MSVILSREEARELDRRAIEEFGVPGIVLMENAGRGIVDLLLSLQVRGPVVICCGKGNNAGDGFVVARHLDNQNILVDVLLFARADELKGDAKINYEIIRKSKLSIIDCSEKIDFSKLAQAAWIVDALFGVGFSGVVKSPYDDVINAINVSPAKILAIDVPSGLDCDTGEVMSVAVQAHHTATCATLKKGFVVPGAQKFIGHVTVIDIGLPKILLQNQ
jgi:NAD(P)H-hydrate epimerase